MLLVYQPASENQVWLAETEQFLPSSHSRRNKLLLSFLFELKFPCKHFHEWNVQIIERLYHRSAAANKVTLRVENSILKQIMNRHWAQHKG